jgi:regulator of protease activity HflC (stomatin/prohibitin superfamily)
MAAQAEPKEKAGKIIRADGEYMAAETLGKARASSERAARLQLRYLQTLVEISGERNSTIIPIPLDILDGLRERWWQRSHERKRCPPAGHA